MGQLVFQATLGGQVNLVGPNTASTFNLNVPAASDTLVARNTTDTLTNKTLTSPTMTAPVLGTPASGTLTNCTGLPASTGITGTLGTTNGGTGLSSFTANGVVYASSTSALTTGSALVFDGTNLGVGVTPVGLDSRFKNVEVGTNASLSSILVSSTNLLTYLQHNSYVDASGATKFKYTGGSNYASQYNQNNGSHVWQTSTAAGTGGNTCTFTTNMTLDSAGNLGLGVTPSTWSLGKAIEVGNLGSAIWSYGPTFFTTNYYYNTVDKFAGTGYALTYVQSKSGGSHSWNVSTASGSAGGNATMTQAMTLDAGGQLQLGTTSNFLSLNREMSMNAASGTVGISMGVGGTLQSLFYSSTSATYVGTNSSTPLVLQTGGSERARIDTSGNLLVGNTSFNSTLAGVLCSSAGHLYATTSGTASASFNRLTNDGTLVEFLRSSSVVGSVSVTTTATTYNTSSDYRLKDVTGPVTSAKDFIMALQPKQGTWKVDGSPFVGFLAHEFQEVSPSSVTGVKDAVDEDGNPIMQAMQASSPEVMANLIALVQEQQDLITQLQADVAALKGNA